MEIIHLNGKKIESSIPTSNNRKILNWMVDNITYSYKNNMTSLSCNMVDELTAIYGKQNKTVTYEYRTKIWVLQYGDLTFNIYTAKKRGTSIEICDFTYDDIISKRTDDIINFLETLHKLIN